MSEMKTLNGYEIVDGKAREDIVSLLARIEALEKAHEEPVSLISFTMHDTNITYQAEEGMTWSEFIESEYNPTFTCEECGEIKKMFGVKSGNVMYAYAGYCENCESAAIGIEIGDTYIPRTLDDTIVADGTYTCM